MKLWIKDLHGSFRAYVRRGDITLFADAKTREEAVRMTVTAMKKLIEREVLV